MVELLTRCRKCETCRSNRRREWVARAMAEARETAGRNWFGTLTYGPATHERRFLAAVDRTLKAAVPWGDLTDEARFRRVERECSRDVTLWLKRVRKSSGARLRYFLVAEQQPVSGFVHYHALVHEVRGLVTARELDHQWVNGFAHWRLVPRGDEWKACGYVAKYLVKSTCVRIRASKKYGSSPDGTIDLRTNLF